MSGGYHSYFNDINDLVLQVIIAGVPITECISGPVSLIRRPRRSLEPQGSQGLVLPHGFPGRA